MILVNGVAADSVAATDRGLAYGDGVFRTLLWRRGGPRWWPQHYRKLAQDCGALAMSCPAQAILTEDLARAAGNAPDSVVKIIVTRGGGARGYAPPRGLSPTRIVMTAPLPDYPEEFHRTGVRVRLCDIRVASQPRLAGVKHLNRLENVLARAEWSDPGVPEGLMLDHEDHIVGGTMTNLFIVEGGELVTPSVRRCGVAGVARTRVMEAAGKSGVVCREEPVSRARLLDAREALLVNSVIGAWQIRACAGRIWEPGDYVGRVREWLNDEGL